MHPEFPGGRDQCPEDLDAAVGTLARPQLSRSDPRGECGPWPEQPRIRDIDGRHELLNAGRQLGARIPLLRRQIADLREDPFDVISADVVSPRDREADLNRAIPLASDRQQEMPVLGAGDQVEHSGRCECRCAIGISLAVEVLEPPGAEAF